MNKPNVIQRAALAAVSRILSRARSGSLEFRLPDGSHRRFGVGDGPLAVLEAADWSVFTTIALRGALGIGEAYADGTLRSPDMTAAVRFLIHNKRDLAGPARRLARVTAWLDALYHRSRANTKAGARENIRAHYDLSNAMFETFLDGSMTYSCGVWGDGDDLEDAQKRKRTMILDKLDLAPGMRLLEIGSGWGSLAIEAARDRGCEVVSITLSEEQLAEARRRAKAAGVDDRIRFELRDYRDLDERFDRVVSVEMIEAVGYENLPAYFGAIDRALADGGKAVVQAITYPEEGFEEYRKRVDFIQKHIFPGSLCPSVGAMKAAMTGGSRLAVTRLEEIGVHYAKTLASWRESFLGRTARLKALGFDDRFVRLWDYYFSYCEAGFETRTLGTVQMVLERKGAPA
jgi:cyclopropane-fatty-acyl-phospholipid synthase